FIASRADRRHRSIVTKSCNEPPRRALFSGTQVPKEFAMTIMRLSLSAAALLAGLGIAAAQQQANDPNQQAPANPQGDGPFKSQQGGKEEPGSHGAGASTEVFVNGKLAVPGAPADSQTVPSKVSESNARLDAMPIMALPLGMSD